MCKGGGVDMYFKVLMWLVLWEYAMEPLGTSSLTCIMD